MTRVEDRTIESIDIDSRVRERIPFDEGDAVMLVQMSAVGAWIEKPNDHTSLSGKLHSDEKTFAFSEGIREGRIILEE
jgi:hypothetical protein